MKRCATFFAPEKRVMILYTTAVLSVLAATAVGLLCGSTAVSLREIFSAVTNGAVGVGESIVLYVRLPRVLASILAGAGLAVSGALIQAVLCNRLASPSIVGVNAGAGLAVTLGAVCGVYGGVALSLLAFFGAFVTVMVVSAFAGRFGRGTVILLGVAINSFLGAVSDTVVTLLPEVGILRNDFRVGDFAGVTFARIWPAAVLILLAVAVAVTLSNDVDVLSLGEETARGLGMNTAAMRVLFLLLAAALAGAAVSMAGLLSFVGLLVPHAVRRLGAKQTKHLLPLCALFGAGFVTLCDTAARTWFAPYELPVGILMAFLGAPFFVWILLRSKGGHARA